VEKTALKVALANTKVLSPLALYGGADIMLKLAFENAVRVLYCAWYGRKDFVGTLDELRCHLFVTKKRVVLAPCHLQRMHLGVT
jgi:hypothetical protein